MERHNTEEVLQAIQHFFRDYPHKVNTKDQERPVLIDQTKIEGVHARVLGNVMDVTYSYYCRLEDLKDNDKVKQLPLVMDKILKALCKDFKSRTGRSLVLKPLGDPLTGDVQYLNNQRGIVKVVQTCEIKNMKL